MQLNWELQRIRSQYSKAYEKVILLKDNARLQVANLVEKNLEKRLVAMFYLTRRIRQTLILLIITCSI